MDHSLTGRLNSTPRSAQTFRNPFVTLGHASHPAPALGPAPELLGSSGDRCIELAPNHEHQAPVTATDDHSSADRVATFGSPSRSSSSPSSENSHRSAFVNGSRLYHESGGKGLRVDISHPSCATAINNEDSDNEQGSETHSPQPLSMAIVLTPRLSMIPRKDLHASMSQASSPTESSKATMMQS